MWQQVLWLIISATWLNSCGTVAPKPVRSNEISFDGSAQNSSLICFVYDDKGARIGALITPYGRERYNRLIDDYGHQFTPALAHDVGLSLQKDGTWFIDDQRLTNFEDMATLKRSHDAKDSLPTKLGL